MAQDYWWVTRPKRKLNTIPEELAAFSAVALGKKWTKNRESHIAYEEELEKRGTKRIGERRDASGSGGRTHAAMLYSLGLWFEHNDQVFLTLAGEAIMQGKSPVPVLKRQVLRFQYPSPYGESVRMSPRFKVHPFIFLLRLLSDERIGHLMQEEIAWIAAIEGENETNKCYEKVVDLILRYRSDGEAMFSEEYFGLHDASKSNLMDVANTMMNWLDYTQLVYREEKLIGLDETKRAEVEAILRDPPDFIKYPVDADIYQRKYGVDPWHQKDTRNLLETLTVTSQMVDKNRILRYFFSLSSLKPISRIDSDIIYQVSVQTGTSLQFVEKVLIGTYPHGAIGGYLSNYRNMAFKGRDEAVDFEEATANLFQDVFCYKTTHLGQTGAKSAPDVLLVSDSDGYQAIIDNKAYSAYSITGDHHNRMVHNYLNGISNYSDCGLPIGFFTYISGGFVKHIDKQIKSEVDESGVHGSGITVSNLIKLIEMHQEKPYSHSELRRIFGLDRQVLLSDISR
jgi:hypothetical protein